MGVSGGPPVHLGIGAGPPRLPRHAYRYPKIVTGATARVLITLWVISIYYNDENHDRVRVTATQ